MKPYHVFINHRGTDVKTTLASSIHHRLKRHGLSVFLDKKELHTGDKFSDEILRAIRSATVHVTIFSENYAESRWCLDELCWILECDRKIIAVFCDVDPADLRRVEGGRYRDAFKQHQCKGRVTEEDIKKWRTALNTASGFFGIHYKTNASDYEEVVDKIVEDTLKEFKWEPLVVANHPVGLDQAAEEIENEIKKQSEGTVIVGIAGMPGIGKSTLASYLYNLKHKDFGRSCFLSEIGIGKRDLLTLQSQLVRDLLDCEYRISSTRQGKGFLQNRLRGLQVLIVLDDVDDMEQIDELLVADVEGSRSLVLITSRDKGLLTRFSPKTVAYDVKPLQIKYARELFCWNAFHQSEPYTRFNGLVGRVLEICDGLPFYLQVLGGLFLKRPEEYWNEEVEKLSKIPPDRIMNRLKLSYEALNTEQKAIFLDIGCFLVGEDKELAVRIFEGLGYEDVRGCLENLYQRCLIGYHYDFQSYYDERDEDSLWLNPYRIYKITMNGHMRNLARRIVREEFGELPARLPARKPVRLSCSDDVKQLMLLQAGAESCLIQGIRFPKGDEHPDCTNYINANGIRFFVVENGIDLSALFGLWHLDGHLVWLRLRSVFFFFHFPDGISLRNLRVLELTGSGGALELLLRKFDDPPQNLSVLNIDVRNTLPASTSSSQSFVLRGSNAMQGFKKSSLFRFLEWIGPIIKLPSKIVLKNSRSLLSLPIDFQELKYLKHLDLSFCINLTNLPKSFSELVHLQYLSFKGCSSLYIPRAILGELSTLEYIDFEGCSKLEYLPTGIKNQLSLRYLNSLKTHLNLPIDLELPSRLEQLRIGSFQKKMSVSVGDLRRLKELKELILVRCENLTRISAEEIAVPNIKRLVIKYCPIDNFSIKDQGTMHVDMGVLRDLTVSATPIKEICIPEGVLPILETLDLSYNGQLTEVKDLPSTLVSLNLEGCSQLTKVKDLPSTLVNLNLEDCRRLKTLKILTNISDRSNLKILSVNGCSELETLNVEGLTSLEEIKAENCPELTSIRGLSQLEPLKCLDISTNNDVMWNDICNSLASTSHEKLSTAFFNGPLREDPPRVAGYEMGWPKMQFITEKFILNMAEIFPGYKGRDDLCLIDTKMEDFQSYGAILMCFLAEEKEDISFTVKFKASNDDASAIEYTTVYRPAQERLFHSNHGIRSREVLHVLMWTEQSELFREYKGYNNILLYRDKYLYVEWGCIMMVHKGTDVLQVRKQIMMNWPLLSIHLRQGQC